MKPLIRTILKEYWEDTPDKWTLLDQDLRKSMDQLIEKHTPNWGDDKYAVMNAIDQMFEDGFFQKVPQSLWEQDEPVEDGQSSEGEIASGARRGKYNSDKGDWEYITPTISSKLFWTVVKEIVMNHDQKVFDEYTYMGKGNLEPYDRYAEFEPILKLFGLNDKDYEPDSMSSKIFHTAAINYNDIKDGKIDDFNGLIIPETHQYLVEMRQTVSEYVEYVWSMPISAYTEEDAEAEVYADEDGLYTWYEWDHTPGFNKEYLEEETQERDVVSVKKV